MTESAEFGPLVLVGGGEFGDGLRQLDASLLEQLGTTEVAVLPTAAAFERPERAVATATAHFKALGATVRAVGVLGRHDALEAEHVEAVRSARFLYLTGGSPLHLRSVLKETPGWEALLEAWRAGAAVVGSSAGAMVLGDPMVDPRGGAFTLGLGLVENLAVVPHLGDAVEHRTLKLAPAGVHLVGIPEQTAAVKDADGWRGAGASPDQIAVHLDGALVPLSALP
ncbi:MAG: Type 1 glutamine amidotransferase-like domain-containing protein [Acidimicrobiales bacterium]